MDVARCLTIHAAPLRDKSDLLPVCYRCGASNALLNPATSHNAICTATIATLAWSFLYFLMFGPGVPH